MKSILNNIYLTIFFLSCLVVTSCDKSNDEPKLPEVKQMVLIYAVNHNNLAGDLIHNENDMLKAMKDFNMDEYKVLVYKYTKDNPCLYEIVNQNGEISFDMVKEYDKSKLSVTPERVSEVIQDATSIYPSANKDLFFWGHGTGWVNPSKYSSYKEVKSIEGALQTNDQATPQSFGGEYISDESTVTEYLDIDKLASAVPDGVFDILWFDCCYMSSIEVAYQLRNKCNTYIAYPTEIMADGLPYSKVLPKVLERNPVAAAKELYLYYTGKSSPEPVTVAVMKMNKINEVMSVAKDMYSLGETRPDLTDMQNYSRYSNAPYWDFAQYMREYIKANVSENDGEQADKKIKELENVLDELVIYKAASERDFNYPYGRPILPENYSGISTHNYVGGNTEREAFYRKLDWFSATRGNSTSK